MARILGHIDYGTKAKPTVPAHGFVASAERKQANATPRERKRKPSHDDLYVWLIDFAKRDARAPQKQEIEFKFGGGGSAVLTELVRAGRVINEVGMHNWRVMRFPGTKLQTQAPKGFRAYRRIDAQGDWWWSGSHWQQRTDANGRGVR